MLSVQLRSAACPLRSFNEFEQCEALRQVPDGEVLPIYLHGSSTAPVIDWVGYAPAL